MTSEGGARGLEAHIKCIEALCRFCGNRVRNSVGNIGVTHLVESYRDELLGAWGVDVGGDEPDIHPPRFCHRCYTLLKKRKESKVEITWVSHKRTGSCESCHHYDETTKKGRSKKIKSGGRPQKSVSSIVTEYFQDLVGGSGSVNDNRPTLSNRFLVKHSFLVCGLCDRVVSCPVETPCHHFFCVACIVSFFVSAKNPCPTCHTSIHYTQLTPAPDYIHSLLSDLHATCLHCNIHINNTGIHNHVCQDTLKADHSYCKTPSPSCSLTPSQREIIGTEVLINKMSQSADGLTATFKTSGKVWSFPIILSLSFSHRINDR